MNQRIKRVRGTVTRDRKNRENTARAGDRACGDGAPTTGADRDPIGSLARRIVGTGLATPTILFIESTRPLGFVASQAVRFAEPVLGLFLGPESVDAVATALEDRKGIERLLAEIERLQAEGGRES